MKFVTTVIMLLLHLSGFAQISVNVYAHLTQPGSIGTLSFDQTISLSTAPLDADGGPVYRARADHMPPYVLYRNNAWLGTVSSDNIYPVSTNRGELRFYGSERNMGYFSVRYVYEMVAPNQVSAGASAATQTCANATMELRSTDNWPLFNDNILNTSVIWEYNLNGLSTWEGLDSSSAGFSFSFVPALYMPAVTSIVNARFRCRVKAQYNDRVYYSPYSKASDYCTIIPAPPVLKNGHAVLVTPACTGKANGRICLPGSALTSASPFMYWLLRPGNVTTPCTMNCGDLVDWSDGIDSVAKGVNVEGVAAGTYTLWLINAGGSAGNCLTPVKVIVPEVAALALNIQSVTHIGCHGGRNGEILVQATGGGGYQYTLKMPGGRVLDNTTGYWNNLAAGVYEAMVSDTTCHEVQRVSVTLTEPAVLTGGIHTWGASCHLPADGGIAVTAPGALITLYNDAGILQTSFSGLPAGRYTVRLADSSYPACPSRDTLVVVNDAVPLSLQLVKTDSVSCHGASDGHLQVIGNGGSIYHLSGPVQMTNTTGDFTHLAAGEYTVQIRRNNPSCNDTLSRRFTIYEPPLLRVTITHRPITCYNAANGYLQANATGGTGRYNYTWERLRQPAWLAAGMQVEDVEPGTYRVTVRDNACSVTSDTVQIMNPLELSIDFVGIREAVCLEDGAAFDIAASGGDGNYTFAYSRDHGETYHSLAPVHIPGEYDIQVTDGKGCMAWAEDTYNIRLPDSLCFETRLSHISCRGNNDGRIDIGASGNGYGLSYSLDNDNWQGSPVFDNLPAGDYNVFVLDDRGCKKLSAVTILEDTSHEVLNISIRELRGVYCGSDTTGSIRFSTSGGTYPYLYSLDNTNWITTPSFSGLSAGSYTIQAKDERGCQTKYATTILAEDPAIRLSARIKPVQCHGTATGEVSIEASGGDGIYHFSWEGLSLTTQDIVRQQAGQYRLVVTDGKGCTATGDYNIAEPAVLRMDIASAGVCDGLQDGIIKVLANGGTGHYTYSLEDADWVPDSVFNNLPAGNYQVVIKDANDCLLQQQVILTKKNIQPSVNFLVVSQNNVSDTLAVREICLPAPDTVNWEFSSAAEWLGTDLYNAPLIRFSQQGDYWIKMSAVFGGCCYNLQKAVRILPYDPLSIPVYQLPASIIDTVMMSPNPNQGYFKCKVQLNKRQQTVITVYDLNGRLIERKQYAPLLLIEDNFDLGKVLPGVYLLRVLTENESKDLPFIISQF
ncbi:T9SS type A sorting domain-containing protein [Chitinophaga sp.]|uniref:T9SS type A sorting domain-containing protein n=1 Tax=Chitinophaga sp. TaxID=1869181 RepID=UPI0031D72864